MHIKIQKEVRNKFKSLQTEQTPGAMIEYLSSILQTENDTAEILDVAVKPEYRKHGIGRSLIDFIFTQFPIYTITAETDDEAVGFYKRCGFNVIGFGMKCNTKRYICNKLKF